jgi:hypothetical protein
MFKFIRSSQPRPVFIIGSYRSATSALTWALGQHPNIFPLEETHFLYKLAVDLEYQYEIGIRQHQHSFLGLAKLTPQHFREHFGRACDSLVLDARKRIQQNSCDAARADRTRISDNVKLHDRWWHSKRRWIDGTPENSHYVLSLQRIFPEAKFIHILRNPRRVATSLMHFSSMGAHDYPEREAYETWIRLVRSSALSEQALGPTRVMRLLHEDLLASPHDALARCVAFVGEKYHPDCLKPLNEKMNSSRYGDSGDCSIKANIESPSPWISEAFSLYQALLNGKSVVEGGAAAAERELQRSLDDYADSLRPDTNESLALANRALEKERDALWHRLKRYELPMVVVNWGPQDIRAGCGFNVQQDGSSALWISTENAPENTTVYLAGEALLTATQVGGKLVTAIVPAELTAKPCTLELQLRTAWSDECTPPVLVNIVAADWKDHTGDVDEEALGIPAASVLPYAANSNEYAFETVSAELTDQFSPERPPSYITE